MNTPVEVDDLVVFFPAGDVGTKRQVALYVLRRYGVPKSHIRVYRPEECKISTWAAFSNLVPLENWKPSYAWTWKPYVVVRGVDLME
jgi:hypothetical protein